MANRRMMSSDMFFDDVFIKLDDITRLVWIGLVVAVADDQGRMQDNHLVIKSQLFPADMKSPAKIASAIDTLINEGLLYRYTKNGKNLLQIVNWWKHQVPSWASASTYPAPDGWIDREKYHCIGNKVETKNWDTKGGFSLLPTSVPTHVDSLYGESDVKSEVKGDVKSEGEKQKKPASATTFFEPAKLFQAVTGMGSIPASQIEKTLPALETLFYQCDRDNNKLTSYLKPYFEAWTKRKSKNGAFYSKANCSWLYDWAIAGEIPTNGNGVSAGHELDHILEGSPIFAEDK